MTNGEANRRCAWKGGHRQALLSATPLSAEAGRRGSYFGYPELSEPVLGHARGHAGDENGRAESDEHGGGWVQQNRDHQDQGYAEAWPQHRGSVPSGQYRLN